MPVTRFREINQLTLVAVSATNKQSLAWLVLLLLLLNWPLFQFLTRAQFQCLKQQPSPNTGGVSQHRSLLHERSPSRNSSPLCMLLSQPRPRLNTDAIFRGATFSVTSASAAQARSHLTHSLAAVGLIWAISTLMTWMHADSNCPRLSLNRSQPHISSNRGYSPSKLLLHDQPLRPVRTSVSRGPNSTSWRDLPRFQTHRPVDLPATFRAAQEARACDESVIIKNVKT